MNFKEFKDLTKLEQASIIESQPKRKYSRTRRLYGVGICDVDFPVYIKFDNQTICHSAYTCWQNMIKRCYYNRNTTKYNPSTVCDEWLRFSNFLAWWKNYFIEGFELDKDFKSLMIFGNTEYRIYSPETCQFIPKWMNLVHRTKHGKVMEIKQQLNPKPY